MASTTKRKIHQYSEAALEEALHEIRQGLSTIRAASRKFGVPRGTLQDRIHGRVSEGPRKMGSDAVLTVAEEIKLMMDERILLKMDDQVRNGMHHFCGEILASNTGFRKVCQKKEPLLQKKLLRNGRSWKTSDNDNFDILKDPSRVLNGDETSFSMCPKTGKVIAPKEWENVYQLQQGNDKETITVLLVFSASGKTVTPMVVFPYIRLPKTVVDSMPADWFLGRSDSGWMKNDVFYEYIANGVNKWLEDNKVKKPVILFVDGHKTHLTLEISEFCANNDIILYALPPNSTHKISTLGI
ncbi:hypothetical protein JTE90_009358 [Oedothorax gibbosus]|uniref:HTH psq-type domain-containing protein n=1 Tax=Oedothorax gibbosus TaxID=931172 RepID=A0AAV6VVJ1_9ARAC|nr:hypothetical protein JTE90_009358 [Oedothorax gibbosus]